MKLLQNKVSNYLHDGGAHVRLNVPGAGKICGHWRQPKDFVI